MISFVFPLAIGNAMTVQLEPPAGAEKWRVLRKIVDSFSGFDDMDALLVYEGDDKSFLDASYLKNDQLYFYRAYYWIGDEWVDGGGNSGTPRATYGDDSVDVQSFVRDRVDAGLQEEVARGMLRPRSGSVQVLTAPPVYEETRWPVVCIRMINDHPQHRGLGEIIQTDEFDGDAWEDTEGWLASVQLSVEAWSMNPDERIALRKSIRRIIVGNLAAFELAGMSTIEFSQQDTEALNGEFPAPVYQSVGTFTCLAPVVVGGRVAPIREVITRSTVYGDEA